MQHEQLIAALRAPNPVGAAGIAASMVGRLGPCKLGIDKLKIHKKFLDWVEEAVSKMRLLVLTPASEK